VTPFALASAVAVVMAGQSNMAGRGELLLEDRAPLTAAVAVVNYRGLKDSREPFDVPSSAAGSSLGKSFALALLRDDPAVTEVWLVQCAVGGTRVDRWDTELTQKCVMLAAGVPRAFAVPVVAVLWAQGEADCKSAYLTAGYGAHLDSVRAQFRAAFGDVPFVASELGPISCAYREDVVAATRDRVDAMVDAADLPLKADRLHFNRAALRELGERFAAALLELGR